MPPRVTYEITKAIWVRGKLHRLVKWNLGLTVVTKTFGISIFVVCKRTIRITRSIKTEKNRGRAGKCVDFA